LRFLPPPQDPTSYRIFFGDVYTIRQAIFKKDSFWPPAGVCQGYGYYSIISDIRQWDNVVLAPEIGIVGFFKIYKDSTGNIFIGRKIRLIS